MGGTVYGDYMAVDLARFALKGLLTKTALDPKSIDYLYYGTVIQEPRTSNIAREASMGAGIPISVPSSTVTMACISSNLAITSGAEKILSGQADIIVAGTSYTLVFFFLLSIVACVFAALSLFNIFFTFGTILRWCGDLLGCSYPLLQAHPQAPAGPGQGLQEGHSRLPRPAEGP